jgi:hypothetical protein
MTGERMDCRGRRMERRRPKEALFLKGIGDLGQDTM